MSKFRAGVLHRQEVTDPLNFANKNDLALPAANVIGTNSINLVLETAREVDYPVFKWWRILLCWKRNHFRRTKEAIAGSISGELHVHEMAKAYGVSVRLHIDHCAKKLLPWIDGVLDAGENYIRSEWAVVVQLTHARLERGAD